MTFNMSVVRVVLWHGTSVCILSFARKCKRFTILEITMTREGLIMNRVMLDAGDKSVGLMDKISTYGINDVVANLIILFIDSDELIDACIAALSSGTVNKSIVSLLPDLDKKIRDAYMSLNLRDICRAYYHLNVLAKGAYKLTKELSSASDLIDGIHEDAQSALNYMID